MPAFPAQTTAVITTDEYLEVVGPPHRSWTPTGEHHVEANARAVTG